MSSVSYWNLRLVPSKLKHRPTILKISPKNTNKLGSERVISRSPQDTMCCLLETGVRTVGTTEVIPILCPKGLVSVASLLIQKYPRYVYMWRTQTPWTIRRNRTVDYPREM